MSPDALAGREQAVERLSQVPAQRAQFHAHIDVRLRHLRAYQVDPTRALAADLDRHVEGKHLVGNVPAQFHRDIRVLQLPCDADLSLANRPLPPGGFQSQVAGRSHFEGRLEGEGRRLLLAGRHRLRVGHQHRAQQRADEERNHLRVYQRRPFDDGSGPIADALLSNNMQLSW